MCVCVRGCLSSVSLRFGSGGISVNFYGLLSLLIVGLQHFKEKEHPTACGGVAAEALAIPGLSSAAAERAFPGARSPSLWRSGCAPQRVELP